MSHVTLLTGPERRRRWSEADQCRIMAAAFAPGATVAAVASQRGLEREVEAGERLDRGQAPHAQCRLDPAVLAQGQLFREQDVHGFEGGDLAFLEPAHDMIERFERPRIFKPTRSWRIRSMVDGVVSSAFVMDVAPSPSPGRRRRRRPTGAERPCRPSHEE